MAKRVNSMTVLRREQITPHMVSLYLGGDGFDDFAAALPPRSDRDTDMYVKLIFMPAGVDFPDDFDPRASRSLPPEQQPVLRTYTIRSVDEDEREIAIDFVVHGDEGIAGPWAATVAPGSAVNFLGPGSGTVLTPTLPGISWPRMKRACPRWRRRSRRCPRMR